MNFFSWIFLSSALALFIRIFAVQLSKFVLRWIFCQNHIPRQTHRIQQQVHSSTAVSFVWFFCEDGFPVEVSSLSRNRPNEVWWPLAGVSSFETGADLPRRADKHTLFFVERVLFNMYDTVDFQRRNLKCRVLAHRDSRGAFDLSPNTELV